jgi:hypothetical protein
LFEQELPFQRFGSAVGRHRHIAVGPSQF